MFLEKFHHSFHIFLNASDDFSSDEKNNIHEIFKNNRIKKIFNFAIILFIWALIASWFDLFLFSGATIMTIQSMNVSPDFYSSFFIFIVVNAVFKFIFIFLFTRKMKFVKIYHTLLGTIPYFGSIFIIGFLLNHERLFFSALKKYLTFIKNKKNLIKALQNKK